MLSLFNKLSNSSVYLARFAHKAGNVRFEHIIVDLDSVLKLIQLVEKVAILLLMLPLFNCMQDVLVVVRVIWLVLVIEGVLLFL